MAWWNPLDWGNYEKEEYQNGADWAETLDAVGADVSPMQAERMAEDLSPDDPYTFHEGFRQTWNDPPTFWQWIRGKD